MIRSLRLLNTPGITGARFMHSTGAVSARRAPKYNKSFDIYAEQAHSKSAVVDDSPEYNPEHLYPKDDKFIASSTTPTIATGRPVPINVAINDYAPFRHEPTTRELVCELHLRAFERDDLDFFADFAQRAAFYLKMPISGSIPLPTRRERWTVIRGPFVHAKSKQNFERRTHKRLLKVYDANPEVVEVWLATLRKHAMPGLGLKANLYTFEEVKDVIEKDSAPVTAEEAEANRHFGTTANKEVADAVLSLLSDPVFKPLLDQTKADTSEGAPEHAIKPE